MSPKVTHLQAGEDPTSRPNPYPKGGLPKIVIIAGAVMALAICGLVSLFAYQAAAAKSNPTGTPGTPTALPSPTGEPTLTRSPTSTGQPQPVYASPTASPTPEQTRTPGPTQTPAVFVTVIHDRYEVEVTRQVPMVQTVVSTQLVTVYQTQQVIVTSPPVFVIVTATPSTTPKPSVTPSSTPTMPAPTATWTSTPSPTATEEPPTPTSEPTTETPSQESPTKDAAE
jgi:hypothetical protein